MDTDKIMGNKKSSLPFLRKRTVAFAGNPNVGKSTLFNELTGMHQHTGNWPGKTVKSAVGTRTLNQTLYTFIDLPGCYSLKSHSPEEIVARDYITSNQADVTVVVCDATSLERNLNLVLQINEITDNIIVCVNLLDEAKRKNIEIDFENLSKEINCPVIGISAHNKRNVKEFMTFLDEHISIPSVIHSPPIVKYPLYIEDTVELLSQNFSGSPKENRFLAIETLENTSVTIIGKNTDEIIDDIVFSISKKAKEIASKCIIKHSRDKRDALLDNILTSKFLGFGVMFLLLLLVFWITVWGANYPTQALSSLFLYLEHPLFVLLTKLRIPPVIVNMSVFGIYHILTRIISVMLPPMAIFFPLFTILEDVGYLPRVAFNTDRCFKGCSACGKQALTMCMGFGCNAAGVVGCRIIDSPREQLIAILTNSFVPCNGRFPSIIALITMFMLFGYTKFWGSFLSALLLTLFIVLGAAMSLLASKLLSKTLLKGVPSSFTLELPPYRKPQVGKIIVRSVFDRTLFVLGRAVSVAAPAGLIIWLSANFCIGGIPILNHISLFLDPLGKIMGLNGVILTAFILGFPANEIVLPLIIMIYTSQGIFTETNNLTEIRNILTANGWTLLTAVNTVIFMLFHWPCSTTCLSIRAETKSWKWTLVAFILPTLFGFVICTLLNLIF